MGDEASKVAAGVGQYVEEARAIRVTKQGSNVVVPQYKQRGDVFQTIPG